MLLLLFWITPLKRIFKPVVVVLDSSQTSPSLGAVGAE
jgi:hypothetical protein